MTQQSLDLRFTDEFPNAEPISRATDPITSRLAAEEITASGLRDSQKALVLRAVQQFPRSTSKELARAAGLDRHLVARRLPDLEADGFVRKASARCCAIGGRPAVTWEAA